MTGHEYMMQVRRIELRIRRISLQIEELESCLLPQGIRYDKDKVQTSPEDTLSKIVGKISDLEKQRTQLVRERRLLLLEIQDALDRLDNENEQIVLEAYYLSRMSMREISDMIGYSIRQAYRLRTAGLQKLAHIANLNMR
jgi:DNA-directed RNA polymerase specialized sigma subunit